MPIVRRGGVVLLLAATVAAMPVYAKSRAVVASVTTAAKVVAPGGDVIGLVRLRSSASVRGTKVRIGLVLAPGSTPKGGTLLAGRPVTVRLGRRGAAVAVTGTIPAGVATGAAMRLLACLDPAGAVKRRVPRGTCAASAGRVRISTATAGAAIAAAVAAGKLDEAHAALYRLYVLAGDPRLPAQFAGPVGDDSVHEAIAHAADLYPSMPAAIQRLVLPLFVPPAAKGSAWGDSAGAHATSAAQAEGPVQCNAFDRLSGTVEPWASQFVGRWEAIPSADGHTLVHYVAWTPVQSSDANYLAAGAAEITAQGRVAAQRFAAAMPKIWATLTKEFGPPQSDANVACYNGGDGRFDVYIDPTSILRDKQRGATGLTLPYPAVGRFCTNRPAFIVIDRRQDDWALAHEFMHALQFAHTYKSCAEPIAFWDEGSADWAADFVYPSSQHEQTIDPHDRMIKTPLGQSATFTVGYQWWPFWMMLQRTYGTDVLRSIFAAMASAPAVDAVDRAIPGGWKQQLPQLLIHLYNQGPIGEAGFPVTESYARWDNWTGRPTVPDTQALDLGGGSDATIMIPSVADATSGPLAMNTIQRVTLPDDNVRELRFTNGGFGQGVHVDAALKMPDGTWKLADWSDSQTITLCRDNAAEDVRELIIFSTSIDKTHAVAPTHVLHGLDACHPVQYQVDAASYSGTQSGTLSASGICDVAGTSTQTFSVGLQPFDPSTGQLQLNGGQYSGTIGPAGANVPFGHRSSTVTGCVEPAPPGPCVFPSEVNEPMALAMTVTIPAGNAPASVTWALPPPYIGKDGYPADCFAPPMTTTPAVETRTQPRSTFLDPGTHTITVTRDVSFSGAAAGFNETLNGQGTASITIHRVNEDGTPYTG